MPVSILPNRKNVGTIQQGTVKQDTEYFSSSSEFFSIKLKLVGGHPPVNSFYAVSKLTIDGLNVIGVIQVDRQP